MGRRRLLAAAAVLLLGGSASALTAGNSMPGPTTAGFGQVRAEGAEVLSVTFSYGTDGRATGFTATLQGNLLLKTVTASYDGGGPLVCTVGSLLDALLNTPVTCTGVAPRPAMPRVTMTVS